jgi:amino acid transporter
MIIRRKRDDDEEEDRDKDDDDERRKRQRTTIFTILAAIFGILTPIVWLLLDDLDLPMDWINRYTLYVAIAFIIHLILFIVHKTRKEKNEVDDEEQNGGIISE